MRRLLPLVIAAALAGCATVVDDPGPHRMRSNFGHDFGEGAADVAFEVRVPSEVTLRATFRSTILSTGGNDLCQWDDADPPRIQLLDASGAEMADVSPDERGVSDDCGGSTDSVRTDGVGVWKVRFSGAGNVRAEVELRVVGPTA